MASEVQSDREVDKGFSAPVNPNKAPVREASGAHRVWLWNAGVLLGLALLVYHLLALWYRWLRPDPEFLAFTASVAELLAIGSFIGFQTERGRDLAEGFGDVRPMRALWGTPPRAFATVWTLAVLSGLALYLGSPLAAQTDRQRGAEALEQGRYSDAIQFFLQSISLEPDEARTHFDLASVYEALHDEEKAIGEYQIALELEHDFWPSYNNLGRLLIEARGRPDAALAVLLAGERQAGTDLGRAVIGKNVAWAYLEMGFPRTALSELQRADTLLRQLWAEGESVEIYLAETSRLEARIQRNLSNQDEMLSAWQDSLGFSLAVAESAVCTQTGIQPPPDCLQAQQWVAEAREQIADTEGDTP
jgi:Tfp pilus assembly protein PilF